MGNKNDLPNHASVEELIDELSLFFLYSDSYYSPRDRELAKISSRPVSVSSISFWLAFILNLSTSAIRYGLLKQQFVVLMMKI